MSLLDQFDHHEKKQAREHFIDLINIAMADGVIDPSERTMLQRMGRNSGFTEPEIESMIESTTKAAFSPPYEFSKRFEQIYNIVKMILADGIIDKNEMSMASRLAIKLSFSEKEIPTLLMLLIDGIKEGLDVDDLFENYKKQRKI